MTACVQAQSESSLHGPVGTTCTRDSLAQATGVGQKERGQDRTQDVRVGVEQMHQSGEAKIFLGS